jgi:hypothetical protein
MGVSDEQPPPAEAPPSSVVRRRYLHRFALVQTLIIVVAVIAALPIAFSSMGVQLTDQQARTLYDFPSGKPATKATEQAVQDKESFINIAAIDIDEAVGDVTMAISGHRICGEDCAQVNFTFFSLDDDADVRRALPPSAPLPLTDDQAIFSQTIQLPMRGQPSQYPFDDYVLWLGVAATVTEDDEEIPLTPEMVEGQVVITTQNQLRDFSMARPVQIDPSRVKAVSDPYEFLGVQELRFERPIHLEILAVLLIALIAVSAILAVFLRSMTDLIIGMGSLILGIWGVRNVLVPQPIPVVTSIDLALSIIILGVLLGLSARALRYFHQESELPPMHLPGRKSRVVSRQSSVVSETAELQGHEESDS